jgi:tRNA nucleotidyltransferase (CCA-adding enzyme)
LQDRAYGPATRLPPLLQAALNIDTTSVAAQAASRGQTGPAIGDAVRAARASAVHAALAAPT